MSTLTIEGRAVGQKRPLFPDWNLLLPLDPYEGGEHMTLRGLITRVVHEEVGAFRNRQERSRMIRTLTHADVERGLMKGKIDSGGNDLDQEVDPETAVDAALLAFEDGIYYVFIDDEQQTRLDDEVILGSDSKVTFLRLVALAGG